MQSEVAPKLSAALNQNSKIRRLAVYRQIPIVVTFPEFDYLKLLGIEFVQKCNGNPHNPLIIHWNILGFIHIDRVAIVKPGIGVFISPIFLGKRNKFMPPGVVEICEPHAIVRGNNPFTRIIDFGFQTIEFVMLRNDKAGNSTPHIHPHPSFIFLDEGKNFFIGNRIDIADDQKFFPIPVQLRNVFPKQGKGRIGNDNVRFFLEVQHFPRCGNLRRP